MFDDTIIARSALQSFTMRRSVPSVLLGIAVGVVLVLAVTISGHPGWGFFSHSECQVGQRLGNVTVWLPAAAVAAPYHGAESGSVVIWGKSPLGTSAVSQPTSVVDGNVTAFYVDYVNMTIYPLQSVSTTGPGPETPCSSQMVAFFSSSPSQGLRSGGTSSWPMYDQLASDTGLPLGLNGTRLCAQIENTSYLSCAVGAQFDLNFHKATGVVDTCGSTQGQVLRVFSQAWPVTVPFRWNGQSHSVPFNPNGENNANYGNGTYAWYNYTFPANGGIWQYDDLTQTSRTGAGLVFSYSPCP